MNSSNKPIYNKRTIEEEIDDKSMEAWTKLKFTRFEHPNNEAMKWVRLTKRSSSEGNLCGVNIVGKKGLFRKPYFANIIIRNYLNFGMPTESFVIEAWRKGHLPKIIFTAYKPVSGGTLSWSRGWDYLNLETTVSENLDAVVSEFSNIVKKINVLIADDRLNEDFPEEWCGPSIREELGKKIMNARKSKFFFDYVVLIFLTSLAFLYMGFGAFGLFPEVLGLKTFFIIGGFWFLFGSIFTCRKVLSDYKEDKISKIKMKLLSILYVLLGIPFSLLFLFMAFYM